MIKKNDGREWKESEELQNLSQEERLALITKLQKEVKELKERSALAEIINDASIDRILAIDTDMHVIAWNNMCEIITGIPRKDIIGKNLLDAMPEIKGIPEIPRAIKMAMEGYKSFVTAEKGSFGGSYCEHHFVPLKDEEGRVIGVLNIIHDVAHRIKVEQELKALNKSLVKKNKELKQKNAELLSFSHITGHDLKEPLRKIYTFVELILNKDGSQLSDPGIGYFKRVQAAVQRMGLLTDDMQTYAQLDEESKEIGSVDLNHLVKAVRNNLQEQIESSRAIIKSDALPTVTGYRTILTQLFQNLVHNAIKFQEPGNIPSIYIKATKAKGHQIEHPDALPDAEYVFVSFIDNGIGFDVKYSDRIFSMFQRLHSGDTYSGTGVGLAICRKIAELHHGFITVESIPGKGSTFYCYLQSGLK